MNWLYRQAKVASGILYNIRHGSRYQVRETGLPNRLVMVVAIDGRKARNADLWHIVLFGHRAAWLNSLTAAMKTDGELDPQFFWRCALNYLYVTDSTV